MWAWLKNQARWIWGVSEMSLSANLEYDKETRTIRPK
jgi:hypothetical protein